MYKKSKGSKFSRFFIFVFLNSKYSKILLLLIVKKFINQQSLNFFNYVLRIFLLGIKLERMCHRKTVQNKYVCVDHKDDSPYPHL